MIRSIKENFMALWLAFLIVIFWVLVLNNSKMLFANIQQLQWEEVIIWADFQYVVSWSTLNLISNRVFDDVKKISFFVIYDAENLSLKFDLKQKPDWTNAQSWSGRQYVVWVNLSKINTWDIIWSVDMSGDYEKVVLWSFSVRNEKWEVPVFVKRAFTNLPE